MRSENVSVIRYPASSSSGVLFAFTGENASFLLVNQIAAARQVYLFFPNSSALAWTQKDGRISNWVREEASNEDRGRLIRIEPGRSVVRAEPSPEGIRQAQLLIDWGDQQTVAKSETIQIVQHGATGFSIQLTAPPERRSRAWLWWAIMLLLVVFLLVALAILVEGRRRRTV